MNEMNQTLLPNETLVYQTRKHTIIFLVPIVLALMTLFFCIPNAVAAGTNHLINSLTNSFIKQNSPHNYAAGFLLLLTLYSFVKQGLLYVTSLYTVTDKRIIMKQGWFDRYISDVRLSTISHVVANQNLMGQLLDYGDIVLNSFGGSNDVYRTIAKPKLFRNQIQTQLEKTPR